MGKIDGFEKQKKKNRDVNFEVDSYVRNAKDVSKDKKDQEMSCSFGPGKKKKKKTDEFIEYGSIDRGNVVLGISSPEKPLPKKENKKLITSKDFLDVSDRININSDISQEKHKKKSGKEKNSISKSDLDFLETDSDDMKVKSRKRKHFELPFDKSVNESINSEDNSNEEEFSKGKKKKKKKKEKSSVESSLGQVDESILQQAGTNLGLPLEETKSKKLSSEKKKKKEKKKKAIQEHIESKQDGTRWTRCLDYLKLWKDEHDSWSFKKTSQVHLLQIMYDGAKMSDELFSVMLQYLEEIKGKGRDKTKEDAEKLLKDDSNETLNLPYTIKMERARQVFQLLS